MAWPLECTGVMNALQPTGLRVSRNTIKYKNSSGPLFCTTPIRWLGLIIPVLEHYARSQLTKILEPWTDNSAG